MDNLLKNKIHEEQCFQNINLEEKELSHFEFYNCDFVNCNFNYVDFSASTFDDCTFVNCSFIVNKVTNCSMRNVVFSESKIQGINFEDLNRFALDLEFIKSQLILCTFIKMQLANSNFSESQLCECDFINNDLSHANFIGCALPKTVFQGNNMLGANFTNAQNYEIDPLKNILKDASFSGLEAMSLLKYLGIKIN